MTDDERMQRESSLIATIRTKLPEFAKACADDTGLVLLHQDAFAADYQENECNAPRHGDQVRRSRSNAVPRSGCGTVMLATKISSGDDRRSRPRTDR
jgi:hypothetical protein